MSFRTEADQAHGKPNLGIEEADLAAVVRTLLLAVRRARPKLLSLGQPLNENMISIQVYNELPRVQRDLRLHGFEFQLEGILPDQNGRVAKIEGRIDFKVKFRDQIGNYNDYFGIECKRVAAAEPELVRYYVESGITKFADETYGAGHPSGMLVGYLIAPPADLAFQRLRNKIDLGPHRHEPWGDYPGVFRDAKLVQSNLERLSGKPIRLIHALLRMHH